MSTTVTKTVTKTERLETRWLGRVTFAEAQVLQEALAQSDQQYLLFLEHPHCFTNGVRAKPEHLLIDPARADAPVIDVRRGGDVTYHGPGQLVGYPIVSLHRPDSVTTSVEYIRVIEELLIATLEQLGLIGCGTRRGYPGVWIENRKIAAIGVHTSRGRTSQGFALNVSTDLEWFTRIVPCGIHDESLSVTSLAAEGLNVTMKDVLAALRFVIPHSTFAKAIGIQSVYSIDVIQQKSNVANVEDAIAFDAPKPEWMRATVSMSKRFLELRSSVREHKLSTVCEEAGCPNIFECWNEGTATFMINGDRCTRACKFCLVDTRKPLPLDADEPNRVASAVKRMNVRHAVVTVVARDDLPDGGANAVAETIRAIRSQSPTTRVEVLISDCKGNEQALQSIFDEKPDVLNHNLETVARLQRLVRPAAGYARSLAVLARAQNAGLLTKSGLMVGLGETVDELEAAMRDLRSVGVSILTVGQYLRPSIEHLPVARWWTPDEFATIRKRGVEMGFHHVEASALTRSSYRAAHAVV